VLFRELVDAVKSVEKASGRLEKVRLMALLLRRLEPGEAAIAARLITGAVLPETIDASLGAGWSIIKRAYESSRGVQPLVRRQLTVREVYELLEKMTRVAGEGSVKKRLRLLQTLFADLDDEEAAYLVRFLSGEPRLGANEGLMLEALSTVAGVPLDAVRRAYMFVGDLGELASITLSRGRQGLMAVGLQVFRPVRPMLAEMASDLREALRECGGVAAVEFKYDGIRLQVHMRGSRVRLFTRRLTDVTDSLPELAEQVKEHVRAEEAVMDSEAISFREGRPVRFQDLVRRVRRKREVARLAEEMPFHLRVFDVIYLEGRTLVDSPLKERMGLLREVVDQPLLAEGIVTGSLAEAEDFYRKSLEAGHEGVVVKRLDSPYTPGARGRYWFKVKPADTLDLVIVGAEWGHGRRRGWLSDYYLAVLDEEKGRFLVVGKTFKGLTDREFEEMTRRLLELKVRDEGWRVWVKPSIVVEVAYSEIQRSPKYESGYALRFARIKRIREDKSPWDVSTLRELESNYMEQFKKKSRLSA